MSHLQDDWQELAHHLRIQLGRVLQSQPLTADDIATLIDAADQLHQLEKNVQVTDASVQDRLAFFNKPEWERDSGSL